MNWNKYQSKFKIKVRNQYLDYFIDPSFQGVNRLFVSLFNNSAHWASYKQYFLPNVEKKDYLLMNDEKNFFDQPVKNIKKLMIAFEKLRQVKEIITQPIVYLITFIPKIILKW